MRIRSPQLTTACGLSLALCLSGLSALGHLLAGGWEGAAGGPINVQSRSGLACTPAPGVPGGLYK